MSWYFQKVIDITLLSILRRQKFYRKVGNLLFYFLIFSLYHFNRGLMIFNKAEQRIFFKYVIITQELSLPFGDIRSNSAAIPDMCWIVTSQLTHFLYQEVQGVLRAPVG